MKTSNNYIKCIFKGVLICLLLLVTNFISDASRSLIEVGNTVPSEAVQKIPKKVKVPGMGDYRSVNKITQGIFIEISSTVPGILEAITESDESMGVATGNNPRLNCVLPMGEQLFKINFEPNDNSMGTQRIFFIEPNQKIIRVKISADNNNSWRFQRTFTETETGENLAIVQQKNNDVVEIAPKKNNESVESIFSSPEKTISTNELLWNNYIIPVSDSWEKDDEGSDANSITIKSEENDNLEMVILSTEVYTFDKSEKDVFLSEMFKSFDSDPSYSQTVLHKKGDYTILGEVNCAMITSVSNNMKMYCLMPYYNGSCYMILAVSSETDSKRISQNMNNLLENISFAGKGDRIDANFETEKLTWDNYVIQLSSEWSKDNDNSDASTITLVSEANNNHEMVILSNEVYTFDESEKDVFLSEMFKSFDSDPSYSQTVLHKKGEYTILGEVNCAVITSVNDDMKMYCLMPYYNGSYYIILAISYEKDEKRISSNMKKVLESISIAN